ncbi:MAG: hypothetical protein CM15mP10_2920 [Actinomycetota bacterium]|nr:MAG: hypothetical protein CM15mP10_2920 [Actinomycetota bacterium]
MLGEDIPWYFNSFTTLRPERSVDGAKFLKKDENLKPRRDRERGQIPHYKNYYLFENWAKHF